MTEKIDISIVIPAYNEAKRLPVFLKQAIDYCKNSQKNYEIIVIDDGSQDETFRVANSFCSSFEELRVFKNKKNRGKGYSVKKGFNMASGDICLFLDADGSVQCEEIEKNLHYLVNDNVDIFIGSRVLKDKDQILKVKWYRKLPGMIFNFFIHIFLFKDIADTQCGFKMFKKETIKPIFSRMYLNRFGFDFEFLYISQKLGFRVKEGPVFWTHVDGSKVSLLQDSLKMFVNILRVKLWHTGFSNNISGHMEIKDYQDMYDLELSHWWFVSRRKFISRLIKQLGAKNKDLLDVGCGTGGNLLEFTKLCNTFGIDASERAVEFCKQRGLENILQCRADKIGYNNNFDIITCLDLLEHIQDPQMVLAELKRVLKDDGKIIITVPAFRFLWSKHDESLGHLRRYSSRSIVQEIKDADLKINKMSYLFFSPFPPTMVVKMFKKFFNFKNRSYVDTSKLQNKYLNKFLTNILNVEMKIASYIDFPLGTSIYLVVSKNQK